ncbi:DUF2339 domain-containing protein [Halovulum sp. GXIMD14793]
MFGEFFTLIIVGVLVYLFFSHGALKRRVRDLEQAAKDAHPTQQDTRPETPPALAVQTPQPATSAPPPQPATPPQNRLEPPAPADIPEAERPNDLPPRAFVFSGDRITGLINWARENWFLIIAALTFAMAGVYLVQYGIEKGLLTPQLRVLSALAFGAILIAAAEWIRRRVGDEDGPTAFLPSTLAGAGLVSIFVGIFAARQLYGLIGSGLAFTGLSLTGLMALILGWFYGPFLIAIGLIGGAAAPFLVGGSDSDANGLYYYFALIAAIALGVDTVKRTAWISVLGLFLAFAAAAMLFMIKAGSPHYLAFALITLVTTATIPVRRLVPDHSGAMVLESLGGAGIKGIWPDFPTRICAGAMLAATAITLIVWSAYDGGLHLALMGLCALFALAALWLKKAAALSDLIILPALGFLALICLEALDNGPAFSDFIRWQRINPEDSPPNTITLLTAVPLAMSLLASLRALTGVAYARFWLIGAAILTPAAIILLDLFWTPFAILGDWPWALHALAGTGLMTVLAERSARATGIGNGPVAAFVLAALTLISLALITMLSLTALTLALAVMTLCAALLDRGFNLPPLSWFVQLGALATGWRLVIYPGIPFAETASITELLIVFGGSTALLIAARSILSDLDRPAARMVLESVAVTVLAILASLLIYRWVGRFDDRSTDLTHWEVGLYATVWLISSAAQIYRQRIGGPLNVVRAILATLFALMGFALLLFNLTLSNPLIDLFAGNWVIGPPVFSSLLIAYGLPALVLILTGLWLLSARKWLKRIYLAIGGFVAACYIGLSIRHFWHGPKLSTWKIMDAEQYSYTVALLLASVTLILLAYLRRSSALRKLGITGIVLTIAKVYLIDASDLTGLTRFFSFLLLGVVLIGLYWLNRVIQSAEKPHDKPLDDADP